MVMAAFVGDIVIVIVAEVRGLRVVDSVVVVVVDVAAAVASIPFVFVIGALQVWGSHSKQRWRRRVSYKQHVLHRDKPREEKISHEKKAVHGSAGKRRRIRQVRIQCF